MKTENLPLLLPALLLAARAKVATDSQVDEIPPAFLGGQRIDRGSDSPCYAFPTLGLALMVYLGRSPTIYGLANRNRDGEKVETILNHGQPIIVRDAKVKVKINSPLVIFTLGLFPAAISPFLDPGSEYRYTSEENKQLLQEVSRLANLRLAAYYAVSSGRIPPSQQLRAINSHLVENTVDSISVTYRKSGDQY